MINVVIADDHPLMREGLKYIIGRDDEINVAGCAANGLEAFELCKKQMPDIVLMDIGMPVCDGIEATRLIKESLPGIKVVILTTFNNSGDVMKAMGMGADSYILKDVEPDKLIAAIKSVSKGLKVIHEEAFRNYTEGIRGSAEESNIKTEFSLSAREMDIIRLIVYGNSNKEIAASLGITESIVRNSISQLLGRFELQDRTQLAVFSIKNKWV